MNSSHSIDLPKVLVAILASAYFFYYASTTSEWHFIDSVNLIIHEGGHVLAMAFPQLIYAMAGSIAQVAIPLIFSLYFDFEANYFASSLLLFWVGQNLLNVSVYVKDAIVMQLPLLGGDTVTHDWNYILTELDALQYTNLISTILFDLGILVLIAAAVLSIYNASK